MLSQNNRRCHGSNRLRLFRVVSLKSFLFIGEFLTLAFSVAVTEPSCKICVGAWPFKDHFLVDCGLTNAFVFEDQFFAGWTVLVLKDHASELFDLSRDARGMLMEEVTHVARTLTQVFDAKKINYELLGNQVPHIHWHLIPRLRTDPDPLKPVWCVPHEPVRLTAEQLSERVHLLRSALRIDPNQPR